MDHHPLQKKNSGGFINFITRRGFIGKAIAAIATMIAAALGVPLAGYTVLPALRKRVPEWIEITAINQLVPDQPANLQLVSSVKDGWLKTTSVKTVWVVRKADEPIVYSPLCTHLGCGYRWEATRNAFFCPCHASIFDLEGNVLAGPAPRPLDRLPIRLEDGRLWTVYKEYKAGTPKKIEL